MRVRGCLGRVCLCACECECMTAPLSRMSHVPVVDASKCLCLSGGVMERYMHVCVRVSPARKKQGQSKHQALRG